MPYSAEIMDAEMMASMDRTVPAGPEQLLGLEAL